MTIPLFERESSGNHLVARATMAGAFFSAALALDAAAASRNTRRDTTQVGLIRTESVGEQSIYVLPGCRMDGQFVAKTLKQPLGSCGVTNFITYPDGHFSLDTIADALIDARKQDGERPASILAISMGGMVLNHLLENTTFREQFGPIDTVVFDSSPTGKKDLMRQSHIASYAAAALPNSYSVGHVYRRIFEHSAGHVHDAYLREQALSTARTPFAAVKTQTRFIRDTTHLVPQSLSEAGQSISHMYYVSSGHDDVVNVWDAAEHIEAGYDMPVQHIVDPSRDKPGHAQYEQHGLLLDLLKREHHQPQPYAAVADNGYIAA